MLFRKVLEMLYKHNWINCKLNCIYNNEINSFNKIIVDKGLFYFIWTFVLKNYKGNIYIKKISKESVENGFKKWRKCF